MSTLWHLTCADHGAPGIRASGLVLPNLRAMLPLAWFTSDPDVPREALGLTSHALTCDRTACRFAAANRRHLIPWRHYAAPRPIRRLLESAPGVAPDLWWVSTRPVPVAIP